MSFDLSLIGTNISNYDDFTVRNIQKMIIK